MAEVIRKATNKFTKGLVMDFSPENTKNDTLTHALNATLLTFNGNELSLQNDMGNARVETAYLPEGYIPVGTCEYGGIIYIVSYNPLEDKSQIGCFPSPERNVSNDELGIANVSINNSDFQNYINGDYKGDLKNTSKYVLLKDSTLNPGDKFIIGANKEIYEEQLEGLVDKDPIMALHIVSIENDGKITYLNNEVRQYVVGENSYHILGTSNLLSTDIEAYRNVLSSGYNVFKSKTSGKLAILAELIMVDSYSVSHSIHPGEEEGIFNIVIHTEIDSDKPNTKVSHYYLDKSEGWLQTFKDGNEFPLEFSDIEDTMELSDIYVNTTDVDIFEGKTIADFKNKSKIHSSGTYSKANINNGTYEDFVLASVKIPDIVINNGLDLPFTYNYTLLPCMNYGKLNHLAVSNTVNFANLHEFNKSDFTTWKYHIDGNQLRLTFGADIYDTFETDKVDALVLEFYDLWGFAGSLEIKDKKSYSGIFTKILNLNTPNVLSTKKVGSESLYKRNINIEKVTDATGNNEFKFKDTFITRNEDTGWDIEEVDNDCGTLYSNMIYGVKSYLHRKTSTGDQYIDKSQFFLYTIPILNDFYYNVVNFNTIHYPELEMMLTYKLEDFSNITTYNNSNITNGYSDDSNVNEYLAGSYSEDSLDIIKYYQFAGTSNLYLEVGLKEDYKNFNLSCSKDINTIFSCTLKLLSNDSNNTYSIENKSGLTYESVLNYRDKVDVTVNYVKFNSGYDSIEVKNLSDYNFITSNSETPIKIDYNFVVGYDISITNIEPTNIPATTFCALFHKKPDETYNYEDFGLYTDDKGNCLSQVMFYNSGSSKESEFGICRLVNPNGKTMRGQCNPIINFTHTADTITTPGVLNCGPSLQEMMNTYVGKLEFCQPHAHGLYDTAKTNIQKSNDTLIIQDTTINNDIVSMPRYNMSLNTKDSVLYGSEFISTIDYPIDYSTNKTIEFSGLTAQEISDFNKCLIKTMSSVYAYNPDYNILEVKVGDPKITDYEVQFTSNIVSTNSKFNFDTKTLNDFIYLGPICFTDYLKSLSEYSDIITHNNGSPLEQVHLVPNKTYCGTSDGYLVSSLTYNTKVPNDIVSDLTYYNTGIIVKDSEGKNSVLVGNPSKNALYTYKNDKLIELDVSSYKIKEDGSLVLSDAFSNIQIPYTSSILGGSLGFGYSGMLTFTGNIDNYSVKDIVLPVNIKPSIDGSAWSNTVGNSIYLVRLGPGDLTFTLENADNDSNLTCGFSACITRQYLDVSKITTRENGKYNTSAEYYVDDQSFAALDYLLTPYSPSIGGPSISSGFSFVDKDGSKNLVKKSYFLPEIWEDVHKNESSYSQYTIEGKSNCLLLVRIDLMKLTCGLDKNGIEYIMDSVINVEKTAAGNYIDVTTYSIKEGYEDRCLVNSTITLNDLSYDPTLNHRLFIYKRSALEPMKLVIKKDEYKNVKMYYRNNETSIGEADKNALHLYKGPRFKKK